MVSNQLIIGRLPSTFTSKYIIMMIDHTTKRGQPHHLNKKNIKVNVWQATKCVIQPHKIITTEIKRLKKNKQVNDANC